MSLTWAAWSKLQAFNLTMSSCIKDWLNWFAWKTTEVLKKKEFWHLIFDEYSFWMTWRIQLETSCFRRETRLNEIYFLWTSWVLVDFSWANEKLYCFLWADKKLSCFFQVNEKLDCFLQANWKLSCFFQANEKLNCFLQANWVLNCFLWAICRLNCFLWAIHELSCFLWVNWEWDWEKATVMSLHKANYMSVF